MTRHFCCTCHCQSIRCHFGYKYYLQAGGSFCRFRWSFLLCKAMATDLGLPLETKEGEEVHEEARSCLCITVHTGHRPKMQCLGGCDTFANMAEQGQMPTCPGGCDIADWGWPGCTGQCRYERGHEEFTNNTMHMCSPCFDWWQARRRSGPGTKELMRQQLAAGGRNVV